MIDDNFFFFFRAFNNLEPGNQVLGQGFESLCGSPPTKKNS